MVRGISRQIIEVRETGNHYYERAYFIVKPEYDNAQRAVLEKEAKNILRKMDAPGYVKKRGRMMLIKVLIMVLVFGLGILTAYLLL